MDYRPVITRQSVEGSEFRLRIAALVGVLSIGSVVVFGALLGVQKANAPMTAQQTVEAYFEDIDFRRFEKAYEHFDPISRPSFEEAMFGWRWEGGLLASYGKLAGIRTTLASETGDIAKWDVELDWLTALALKSEIVKVTTVKRNGQWFIVPNVLRPVQTPARLQRGNEVTWNVVGRRQPRFETDLHRDRLDRPRVALHGARLVTHNGRYSLVGALTNADADPALTSLFGDLVAGKKWLTGNAAGIVTEQRLLPAETSGFRIDFEGVLSLEDEAGSFDPSTYIPPKLDQAPTGAKIEARALVVGSDLYRAVALNNVRITSDDDRPRISGLAVNTGTETATIARIIALLYDLNGDPIWSDAGFVETNIYPGQSAPFSFALPARQDITVVEPVGNDAIAVNGSTQQTDTGLPGSDIGTIPLTNVSGYSAIRLHVSTMTHDPLF